MRSVGEQQGVFWGSRHINALAHGADEQGVSTHYSLDGLPASTPSCGLADADGQVASPPSARAHTHVHTYTRAIHTHERTHTHTYRIQEQHERTEEHTRTQARARMHTCTLRGWGCALRGHATRAPFFGPTSTQMDPAVWPGVCMIRIESPPIASTSPSARGVRAAPARSAPAMRATDLRMAGRSSLPHHSLPGSDTQERRG